MYTDREQVRRAILERSASTRAHNIGATLVFVSFFSTILLKYQPLILFLAIILPCTSIAGVFLFVFETFRTGVAIRGSIAGGTTIYRSDGLGNFYATAITSSLVLIVFATAVIVASFIAWQRATA